MNNFKLVVLEFNKYASTIDEFSDLIHKTLNENNDLISFKSYELAYNGDVRVEMVFGNEKTKTVEALAYGPNHCMEIIEQLNSTMQVAITQSKTPSYVVLVPSSKSSRCFGFLILEKGADKKDHSAEVKEEKRTEDTPTNAKPARRRTRAE